MRFLDRFGFIHNKRFIAAGLAAVIILSCSIPNVKASMVTTEKPLAGINVALEESLYEMSFLPYAAFYGYCFL